jgi:hypothetical protein
MRTKAAITVRRDEYLKSVRKLSAPSVVPTDSGTKKVARGAERISLPAPVSTADFPHCSARPVCKHPAATRLPTFSQLAFIHENPSFPLQYPEAIYELALGGFSVRVHFKLQFSEHHVAAE